ncbi:hypothetical protein DP067_03580 [Mycoplasmopsis anatis]|uniref:Uncharacterized protein n=1 Tax=Mycoplasmopsis anatis 1340 TaxID=1034808 RepID=F9QCL1_9BACT|nr:type II toxin-antitoxin system RnlB family antitoxin [Mycoplasmopsis anatis]AWX70409.1 hypothetical protein DP067_03580 [Mycoplasmopsis anatis]EGS29507.1 hypothetical protein GIG_00837 [Mycoplasmopsis anatis 1340]VEU73937.1 Uncharacterised protein [Mycoplasmopsis anatis]
MKPYLINNLKMDSFDVIITLLDYRIQISEYLMSIKIFPTGTKRILIDTALCSGINEYRFIEVELKNDDKIDLDCYSYVVVNDDIIKKANEILKYQTVFLDNCVLTKSQIKKIVQTLN